MAGYSIMPREKREALVPKPRVTAGGGWTAIGYSLRKGREAGGALRLYRRLRSRNACKTCAYGMGGQRGGMVNEQGRFPEVCKKSIQAQAGDMQPPIAERRLEAMPLAEANECLERYRRYWEGSFERLDALLDELKTMEKERGRNQR